MKLAVNFALILKFGEVVVEISLVAELQHNKNLIFFPGYVFNFNYMLILP